MPSPSLPRTTRQVDTAPSVDAAVLWLHGLGADGSDFEPIVPLLPLPDTARIRFLFPNAPVRPITINGGMAMPGWFDLYQLGPGREDSEGIIASGEQMAAMIQALRDQGIDSRRIVVAGFSQGGVVALQAGLRYEAPLAGILAMSTWLARAGSLARERHEANRETPVLMLHGDRDEMVDVALARRGAEHLQALGQPVQFKTWPMGHEVCPPEIEMIGHWLAKVLPPLP
ncbi:MAG: dienelactone hydrolase family protein [Burkholderiaceae bacterium]